MPPAPIHISPVGFISALRHEREENLRLKKLIEKSREDRWKLTTEIRKFRLQSKLTKCVKREFFHGCNTEALKNLMMRINLRDVKCKCDACLEAGRIGEEDHIFGQVHIPCMFAPYWERLLDYYSITFVHAPLIVAEEPDDQDPLKGTLCFECSEAIVSLDSATDVWKDVAYGRAIGLDNVPHAQNVQRRNLKHLFRSHSYIEDSRVSQRMPGPSNSSSLAPTRSVSRDF